MSNDLLGSFQLGGLSGSFDTNTVIQQLMKIESMPLEKAQDEYKVLQNTQKAWDIIDDKLEEFYNYLNNFKLKSSFLKKNAMSSNEDIMKVSSNGNAGNSTFYVNIKQAATAGYIEGQSNIDDKSKTLADLGLTSGKFKIQMSGLNPDGSAKEAIEFDLSKYDADATIDSVLKNMSSKMPDANIIFEKDSSGSNFKAFVMNKNTGEENFTLTAVDADGGKFLGSILNNGTSLNANDTIDTTSSTANYKGILGKDAEIAIDLNGDGTEELTLNSSSNAVSFNGMTLNIQKESEATDWTKISVEDDVNATYDNIKEFTDKYNEVMKFLYDKLYTETEVQGKEEDKMTDEEKAKGVLKGNSNLRTVFEKLKSLRFGTIEDSSLAYNSFASVGISSGISSSLVESNLENARKGLISIDETKLKEALRTNSDAVFDLFNIINDDSKKSGIANQIKDYVWDTTKYKGFIDEINGLEGSLSKEMKGLSKRMLNLTRKINMKEAMYVRQFSAMEQAISKMQSQGNYLLSKMG
ncbi:flagellar hook-associated protein 2 [Oceanotoga teriensis]|uniref:Flagellar hook-associated protein 2 n=1 Tax=Oceanotoga teriensis TaxID=515440 RepID=A0AA45C828_9BACT|nr:flagellar filament capping protein FliD [Oceanotoga teriensis]PWJ95867.1 flagellar hook-associated protein 2 [Oceanotoga teriensis]